MNITGMAMVRNEIDVIAAFTSHIGALCDSVIIVDHMSTDGTTEHLEALAAADPRFELYRFAEPAYEQSLLMTTLAHQLPTALNADWLLLLDADEFVAVSSREELEQRLGELNDHAAVTMEWRNAVPASFESAAFDFDQKFWVPESTSPFNTIAINRAMLRNDTQFAIAQGNHQLLTRPNGFALPMASGPDIYHVPVRSEHQIVFKAVQGLHSYARRKGVQDPSHGAHWRHIVSTYESGELDEDLLRGFAASYGTFGDGMAGMTEGDLEQAGFVVTALDVAAAPLAGVPAPEPDKLAIAIGLASAALDPQEAVDRPLRRLTIDDRIIRRADDDSGVIFAPLAARPVDAFESITDDRPLLYNFLQPHAWPMTSLVPSAWAGHIPLMFCMIRFVQPRRFVELGSHFGASFFAACQAVERLGLESECVAIDSWQGDEHAGFYENDVYDRFMGELKKTGYSCARHVRALFEDAAHEFDDGSIDLLHIDGLHTYEAVLADWETWLPKLTDDAVVMFHDTNVHERDFGVWQLFQELSADHLTFNFLHSHGLGILVREGAVDQPIGRLIRLLATSDADAAFAQLVAETSGDRAVADARLRMIEDDFDDDPYAVLRRAVHGDGEVAALRLELNQAHRAESDLRWFIGRLDRSPFGPAFRRYPGFRTLKERWLPR